MNQIISLLTSFALLISSPAFAQTSAPITFPIVALGNCADKTACKKFCDETINQAACEAFAKANGLVKTKLAPASEKNVLEKATTILGCSDITSCKTLCSQKENFQKCSEFAKSNNLPGGEKKLPSEQELLPIAKEIGLQASNSAQLRSACNEPQNREACTRLAEKMGLKGGIKETQPPQPGKIPGQTGSASGSFAPKSSPLPIRQTQGGTRPESGTIIPTSPIPVRLPYSSTIPTGDKYQNTTSTGIQTNTGSYIYATPISSPTIQKTETPTQTQIQYPVTTQQQPRTGTVQGTETQLSLPERILAMFLSFLKR